MKKSIVSFLLIGLLLCSVTTLSVSASPDSGLETLSKGDKFDYKSISSSQGTIKDYKTGETYKHEARSEGTLTMEIEEINESEGYLTVVITGAITWLPFLLGVRDKISEDETMRYDISVYNDDGDDTPEDLNTDLYFQFVIAGTWDTYTERLTDFKDTLDDLADQLATFEYSLTEDRGDQHIELILDYKIENELPDRYREYPYRIVREYHEEYTIDYDDFVIKGYTNKQTMEVVELVGNDYLKEKERILTTESNREVSIRRLGFFRKETAGIPHWVWIGTAVAVVALGVNVYFLKVWKS